MSQLDALTAQVAANTNVTLSAIDLLNGIAAKLKDAGNDPVAIAKLAADLKANTDSLAAAVVANTPAAPDVAPAVDPAPAAPVDPPTAPTA